MIINNTANLLKTLLGIFLGLILTLSVVASNVDASIVNELLKKEFKNLNSKLCEQTPPYLTYMTKFWTGSARSQPSIKQLHLAAISDTGLDYSERIFLYWDYVQRCNMDAKEFAYLDESGYLMLSASFKELEARGHKIPNKVYDDIFEGTPYAKKTTSVDDGAKMDVSKKIKKDIKKKDTKKSKTK